MNALALRLGISQLANRRTVQPGPPIQDSREPYPLVPGIPVYDAQNNALLQQGIVLPPGGYSVVDVSVGSADAVRPRSYQRLVVETLHVEQLVTDKPVREIPKISWLRELLLCVTCLTFIFLFIFALASFTYLNSKVVCHTPACNEYSRLLTETISSTVDPCRNFYQFVCEGYDKRHEHSVKDEHRRYHKGVMESYAALQNVSPRDQTTPEKAAKFYQSCIGVYLKNNTEPKDFLNLLKQLNFSWPQEQRSRDLLSAMASYNTRLGVSPLLRFTKVRMVNGTSVVHIAPGTFPSQWLEVRKKLLSKNNYFPYFQKAYEIIKGTKPNRSAFSTHRNLEDWIMVILTGSSKDISVIYMSLEEFKVIGRIFSFARWKEAFNQLLDVPENGTITIKLSNPTYFDAFSHATSKVSETAMVYFLEWAVLFQLGSLFFRDLADLPYDTLAEAKEASCHRCYHHVDRHMSCALSHTYFTSSVPYESYSVAKDMAFEIHHQTAMRLGELESIAFDYTTFHSHEDATYMFKFYVMHSSYLVLLSSVYPDMEYSFLKNHLNVVAARKGWNHSELFDYACLDDKDDYNFHDDEVQGTTIPPVALLLPIFSINATTALQYGTLGTLIARSVMRNIYVNGRRNMTQQDQDLFGVVEDCIINSANATQDTVSEQAVYEAASATIAWRSYQTAAHRALQRFRWVARHLPWIRELLVEQDQLLPGMLDYNPNKIFFISACYVHCAGSTGMYDGSCNAIVKNSRHFSDAFGCPLATVMNPVQKCGFR